MSHLRTFFYNFIVVYRNGCDNMGFRLGLRKNQNKGKLMNTDVTPRLEYIRFYEAQLDRLDAQLQTLKIDKLERDRLRSILEATIL